MFRIVNVAQDFKRACDMFIGMLIRHQPAPDDWLRVSRGREPVDVQESVPRDQSDSDERDKGQKFGRQVRSPIWMPKAISLANPFGSGLRHTSSTQNAMGMGVSAAD